MNLSELVNKPLKISRFAHLFEREKNSQLFNSIFMSLISIDQESKKILNEFKDPNYIPKISKKYPNSSEFIQKLIDNRFLISSKSDEISIIRNFTKKKSEIDINMMYLLLTDKCNLNCKYCFIEGGMSKDYSFSNMSEETMKKGINLFVDLSSTTSQEEGKRINFYGGEPLLQKELIIKTVNYINKEHEKEKINLNMVTNGCLLDEEIAKFLTKYDFSIGVSIDGKKENHNKARNYINGNGTFDDAIKGFLNLKKAGSNHAGISLTIGRHNIDDLKENVQYLVENFHPSAFGFNFLVDFPQCENPLSVPIEYATEKAIEAFQYLRAEGIFEERLMRKIQPFVREAIHLKDCGAIGNQIVLTPDGKIGPCHAFISSKKYFSQSANSKPEEIKNDLNFNEWSKRYPINMDDCLDCSALGLCGGGCPYNSYIHTGSIWKLDERMCKHNKMVLDWILREVNNESKVYTSRKSN